MSVLSEDARSPLGIRFCGPEQCVATCTPKKAAFSPASIQSLFLSSKSLTNLLPTYSQMPTVEEAQAILDRAAIALGAQRYRDALRLYLDGGYAMANIAKRQANPVIDNLLASKAFETLNWCLRLSNWIEGRVKEKNPRPRAVKVGIPVETWFQDWIGLYLDEDEARRMWYTPVYCPQLIDFSSSGYHLRCVEVGRRPRLMICITMYNEGPQQLQATLRKLANNLTYLKDHEETLSSFGGENGWQNVLVCIVADGREQVNDKMLDYLTTIGLYDETLMTINSAGIGARCHLFEHTLQLSAKGKKFTPIQAMFALKETKVSKIDSHHWFFNAFAEQIQPEYTVMMDVGTLLTKSALYHMLFAFERNHQIGGACGQVAVDKPFENLTNWVISAQNFEYKISNILDKSLESCFGFISVLPGAFSAYRYEAIRGAPLNAYFQTLNIELGVLGPFLGNMYLAEDRILSFEVVARKDRNWTTHYVKDAVARTDVPQDLIGLISQRKRWLNGAFFATLFSIWNWDRIYLESNHSSMRKLAFLVFYLYYLLYMAVAYVMPANLYLLLYFIVFQGFQQNRLEFVDTSLYSKTVRDGAVYVFNWVYLFGLLIMIIIGLGNNPKHMKLMYYFASAAFGFIMTMSCLVAVGVYLSIPANNQLIAISILTVGVFFLGPALHGELHHIMLTFVHYMALIPSFVNIFSIYSFCNLQNLSWGTKGLHDDPLQTALSGETETDKYKGIIANRRAVEDRRRQEIERTETRRDIFEAFRTNILLSWVSSNLIFALFAVSLLNASTYITISFNVMAGINLCRLLGCIGHWLYIHTAGLRDGIFAAFDMTTGRVASRKNIINSSSPLLQKTSVSKPARTL
ncbi:chitin synthase 1 [Plasmopara halstedii]|uniref:chitin synthase n=1 Tax=Plasmopara halstedii TaxID=4781 RepID=A0A0P1B0K8_PLAHL|nr:chitin synthase 1 [Plasmopara halstedii]CEG46799.1 chitin synthase 1 [Plasmopara halstedii]|eukprot:XP_024583168.1 chitin synthase 1 [Plasmopara halstedii]